MSRKTVSCHDDSHCAAVPLGGSGRLKCIAHVQELVGEVLEEKMSRPLIVKILPRSPKPACKISVSDEE